MTATIPAGYFIFDFDGILVDTEPLQLRAVNNVLADYDINIPRDEWASECVGYHITDIFRRYVPDFAPQLVERKHAAYLDLLSTAPLEPRPGILPLIDTCNAANIALAVASSSAVAEIKTTLEKLDLLNHFQHIVSVNQVARPKPHPDVYQHAAELLGTAPERAAAIEDTPTGIASAKSAGMLVFTYPNAFTESLDLSAADVRFDELNDPDAIVQQIIARNTV